MPDINCMRHFSFILQFLHNLCKTALEKIRVAGTNGSHLSGCVVFFPPAYLSVSRQTGD